ncbi:unnamed protein product [Polarella glacialis]|nr:unnamed protein product [Polarella glacialis]
MAEPGLASALRVLLLSPAADLKADLEKNAFSAGLLGGAELEVAEELRERMLSAAGSSQKSNGQGTVERLLQRLAKIGGGARRSPVALARELEAAEQYCRALAGAAPVASNAEPRPPAGGRDALVSEAQAGGGSTLHRWIRLQVCEPLSLGPVLAGPASGTGGSPVSGTASYARGQSGRSVATPMQLADVPHEFLCPIAQDVMRDAVSTCDGYTYERRNIESWLAENNTSPITGLPLANKGLIPNHNLRKLIFDSGVLSRLGSDSEPNAEAADFRSDLCCEVVVPRDAATLSEAIELGAGRAAAWLAAAGSVSEVTSDSIGAGTSQASRQRRAGNRSGSGSPRTVPSSGRPLAFGVRLLPGEHFLGQMLQLDQEVEIIGGGRSATMLRLAPGVAIELRGDVRIARLSICRDAPPEPAGPGGSTSSFRRRSSSSKSPPLLEVTKGSSHIELCDLCNSCGSAVRVSGAHTSPVMSGNTIHGCRDTGVVFRDGADGSLVGCRLFSNLSVAIEVHSRADPLIEDNDVFDGRQGGVFVYNRGKGHLRRNKIFRNALEGVEIKQGGRPLVEDNDIYDNMECGIFIHEGGEGRVIGNRIHSNSYAGIEIKDASSPEVRGNDVYSGRTSGVYIHGEGQGVIEDNQVHNNALHGVYVRGRGHPHLVKNRIFSNDECGVFVTESSNPCIESNEVYGNGLAGIEVKEESNPTIKLNRIHDGNTGGIFILARGRGRIYENKLYKNKLEGIEIKDGGDPHITDNDIYENLECGVFAHDGALGRIEDNRVYSNAFAGIEIKDTSCPVVKGNHVYRGQTSGIYVHSGGRGKVMDNEVFENGLHGIMILSAGNPWMSRNRVHDNLECGVVAHQNYVVDTVNNEIFGNGAKNIQTVKV